MPRLVISVALALALACGDREVERLEQVRDTVCACKTTACADGALKTLPQTDIRASARARAVARAMLDCYARLNEADRPTSDPDAQPVTSRP